MIITIFNHIFLQLQNGDSMERNTLGRIIILLVDCGMLISFYFMI